MNFNFSINAYYILIAIQENNLRWRINIKRLFIILFFERIMNNAEN
jgi:hypothetical protein